MLWAASLGPHLMEIRNPYKLFVWCERDANVRFLARLGHATTKGNHRCPPRAARPLERYEGRIRRMKTSSCRLVRGPALGLAKGPSP
jgi:hypothetical protein